MEESTWETTCWQSQILYIHLLPRVWILGDGTLARQAVCSRNGFRSSLFSNLNALSLYLLHVRPHSSNFNITYTPYEHAAIPCCCVPESFSDCHCHCKSLTKRAGFASVLLPGCLKRGLWLSTSVKVFFHTLPSTTPLSFSLSAKESQCLVSGFTARFCEYSLLSSLPFFLILVQVH